MLKFVVCERKRTTYTVWTDQLYASIELGKLVPRSTILQYLNQKRGTAKSKGRQSQGQTSDPHMQRPTKKGLGWAGIKIRPGGLRFDVNLIRNQGSDQSMDIPTDSKRSKRREPDPKKNHGLTPRRIFRKDTALKSKPNNLYFNMCARKYQKLWLRPARNRRVLIEPGRGHVLGEGECVGLTLTSFTRSSNIKFDKIELVQENILLNDQTC